MQTRSWGKAVQRATRRHLSIKTCRLVAVVQHAKGKSGAACKGQKGTRLTCSSLSNGSKGYEQHQQLRPGEVQQAGGVPPGEEEGC